MAVSSPVISYLFISFILSVSISFTNAEVSVVHGKFGERPPTVFSTSNRDFKLICDLKDAEISDNIKPRWTFMKENHITENVESSCNGNPKRTDSDEEEDDDDVMHKNATLFSDCNVKLHKTNSSLELDIEDIKGNEFGDYVCHTGNMSRANLTIQLREIVQLTMKNEKGKIQKQSVTLDVGEQLYIYCNQTGYYPSIHKVSWWRGDGENITDITQDLNEHTGLFENFTKTNDLQYNGTAIMAHRGNYTCQVDLSSPNESSKEVRSYYPVKFTFNVRVKEGDEWKLPSYVLLGECVFIALFTLIINQREKKKEDPDYPAEDSDSDDDDDVQPSSSGNGTQNNNKNGK